MKYILLLLMAVTLSFASIGKITAINGSAYALRGSSKVVLKLGSEIEKKDQIKTMKDTKLQIVFNDHTVISLGQKTNFKIDDYIFSKTKVKASFSVSKGIFKSITGKIGKIDHSKFKLRTKNATIGVRGTTFIGVIDDNKETIACTSGEIVVENDFGVVDVKRGEMTTVRDFQAPKVPKVLDKKFFKKVESVKPAINSDNIVIESKNTYTKPNTQNIQATRSIEPEIMQTIGLENLDREIDKNEIQENIKQDEVVNVFKSIINKKKDQENNSNTVSTVDNVTDTVSTVTDSSSTTSEVVDNVTDTVTDASDTAGEVVDNVVTQDTDTVSTVTDSSDTTTDTTNGVVDNVTDTVTDASDTAEEVVDNVVTQVTDSSDTTTDTTNGVVDNVTDTVTDVSDTAGEVVDNVVTQVTDTVSTVTDSSDTQSTDDDIGGDFSNVDMTEDDTSTDDATGLSDELVADLNSLKEKVGGQTQLHYEGEVAGENIISDNNKISLDFDLGKATVEGNVKFSQVKAGNLRTDWDTDVSGGFNGGNTFSLKAKSDGYSGEGHADLVGDHLEQAQGSMHLKQGSFPLEKSVDIDFVANKNKLDAM